ncbi:MAG TPA: hypothetical protein VMW62_17130 [Chloroflexota bacterium]|nr:hypothetical protein [Chloroflexota bacterium]
MLIAVAACSPQAAPSAARSAPDLMQIDIQRGWSFKPDPSGQADWSAPSLDDGSWDVIDANDFWQKQGYEGYAGVAWYRRWVDVPSMWGGRQAYLVIGGVNDEYRAYVDGHVQGAAGSLEAGKSAILHATETPVSLTPGKRNLLAIKVRSAHNFGGIAAGPVVLATQPRVPPSLQQAAVDYAKAHPEGVWPGWMHGQGRSWTVVGLPQGGPESLEGPDGSWEATSSSPAISAWLIDHSSGLLARPGSAQDPASGAVWGLAKGHLPLLGFGWPAGQVQVNTLLWQEPAVKPGSSATTQWRVQLHNQGAPRDVSLWVALRPYQVQPGIAPLFSVSAAAGKTVLANGKPALISAEAASRVAASTGELGDVSMLARAGPGASPVAAEDGSGMASLALIFDLHLGAGENRQLSFAAPTGETSRNLDGAIVPDPTPTLTKWGELLHEGSIQVPDTRVTDAYYASLAYILMSNDGGALHPGPLLHDAFWYRDSAYMLSALERGGLLPQVRDLLPALSRFQTADGEFPANASTHSQVGHRRGDPEWDAQGEGIHSLVEYYRFSSDLNWLRTQWTAINSACQWLERLIGPDGLLPPGLSAEDLGPAPGDASQQHFWDDFWGVIGLRDAAFAASALGETSRASQLGTEAGSLLKATLAAGQPGLLREGIFPNSPNSQQTPADARGTSPAVWPGQLVPAEFARAQFQGYFDRFVRPYGGAFRHEDNNFWPFGGLEIAHASLYAGLPDQANYILDWQLSHQTGKGVWAWGDEVSQDGSRLIGGDMPHGWTAAEYVDLVRDMLLYESGDTLQLAAGVRSAWLADGKAVAVNQAPTYFGTLTYRLRRAGSTLTLALQATKPPPGGYDLHLPFQATALDGSPVSGAVLHLPSNTQHATITITA